MMEESQWHNWEKTGQTEFGKLFQRGVTAWTNAGRPPNVDLGLKRLVYDLVVRCIRDQGVKRDHVVQFIGEKCVSHAELSNMWVDVFALLDNETSLMAKDRREERERFVRLFREAEKYLSTGHLKERIEVLETLEDIGVLKSTKKFFTSMIKLKTKLFYKQQKFNLFHEECEGFAKLLTELNQDLTTVSPKEVLETIKSIIGYFNLDPNRTLDIILESFECRLEHHRFYIHLLQEFVPDPQTLNELLAFKYKFYESECVDNGGKIPESLFTVTALLIQYDILDMDTIYGMLKPDDAEIESESDVGIKDAREFVRKMNVVSTNKGDKPDLTMADFQAIAATYDANQKLGLIEAFLRVGAWTHAEKLMNRLPPYFAVSQEPIAKALQRLVHLTIQPLVQKCSNKSYKTFSSDLIPSSNQFSPILVDTFEQFKTVVMPMLMELGPHASSDLSLLYKIMRILKADLKTTFDETGRDREKTAEFSVSPESCCLYYETITLTDAVLLPSLSLAESNCCLAEEIWSVLRVFPYHVRYHLFGQWKANTYDAHPLLLRKKAITLKGIKRIMQRISKENVKPTSRLIGKITHSSPGLVFEYILSQIQLYDNMITPVVDSLRYLTSLSFDVLGYSIIEALNNPEKDRTKHDGTSISLWLTSLSNFCGAVYKKYNIELTGLLQYVANQLKNKHSLDLLIMKEVVLKMGGIEGAEEMTSEQIDAMAGGELLRQEAGSFTQIKNTKKSSQRLKDALIDHDLAVPLCLLMAQQRNCVVYQETEDSHLKLVGKLFDQCQDTLVQFGTFLASNLSIDDYTRRLPPIQTLLSRYHVNLDLAFFLARPMFNHQISLQYENIRKNEKHRWKTISENEKQNLYVAATTDVMTPITEAIRPLHSVKIWDDISPQFLTTFWSLTMYDLFVPEDVYGKEIQKLVLAPSKVDDNKELNSSRKKKEKERLHNMLEKIQDEQKKQKDHVERVMARLKTEKDSWFFSRSARLAKNETITTFLQLCLFPRCIFTAIDAIYCAKFVQVIHMLKTPNFSTLICFDRIFCDITYTVTSCTENEAHRYGRFLAAMLELVMKWHSKKEIFDEECVGYPGFVTKFRVAQTEQKPGGGPGDSVDYENYRHVCHKWHYKIAKALVVCLESKDYVQIRNALTILFKILGFFPMLLPLAGVLERRIEKVVEEEKDKRMDLCIMARSYQGQLKAKRPHMMLERDFHIPKEGKGGAGGGPKEGGDNTANDNSTKTSGGKSAKPEESRLSSERSSKSRSQSRENSLSRSNDEPASSVSSGGGKYKKNRDRDSKERSLGRDSSSRERSREPKTRHSSKDRERREEMGPPQSSTSHRRSAESESMERELKRRKPEDESGRRFKDRSRERSEDSDQGELTPPPKKEKSSSKSDRKRERDEMVAANASSIDNNGTILKRSKKEDREGSSSMSSHRHGAENGGDEMAIADRKSGRANSRRGGGEPSKRKSTS
ncbi:hypothetical protein TCAL_01902 [Tigriopus californicus]|uniref:THO complex subunit 2 n=1 Tax=Tigriopus californicus TaxID=6832 RepID=A0A553P853_TIGCA|nr:THO complex subunit 2-like [Tigriopus californicus]TRY73857.1 hypothetical protein TCAL_01902 [Tigriopus californicus]